MKYNNLSLWSMQLYTIAALNHFLYSESLNVDYCEDDEEQVMSVLPTFCLHTHRKDKSYLRYLYCFLYIAMRLNKEQIESFA